MLCSSATWNASATTFANQTTMGTNPFTIFINRNNTIYASIRDSNSVQVWINGSSIPTTISVRAYSKPMGLFVSDDDTIYVDNDNTNVASWQLNQSGSSSILYTMGRCSGLFIDKNNSFYCSSVSLHQVMRRSLNSNDTQIAIVAGENCYGFSGNKLYYPMGIFVDNDYHLYVADQQNHRIQLFRPGQINATTIAGTGALGTILLNLPSDVKLDANNNIYIVDQFSNRIVKSYPNGFRCIIGCQGYNGYASYSLNLPQSMAFDSYGNIFVIDQANNRIQKFFLATNSCGM